MIRIIMTAVLLLTVNAAAFSLFDGEKDTDRQYVGLVRDIKDVVITTQKTRGLTNNYMNGNVVAQLLVYGQRSRMKEEFKNINALLARIEESGAAPYAKQIDALREETLKLNKKAFRKDAAKVFEAYTVIIEKWMQLSRHLIDKRFRKRGGSLYAALVFQNDTLLPLTENIGKMRGMGSGIVARGSCKKEEVPKMEAFADAVRRYRDNMVIYLKTHPLVSQEQLHRINEKIAAYTKLTREKVIGKKGIKLDPNRYFDQGTACIGEVQKVYDAVSKEIDKAL